MPPSAGLEFPEAASAAPACVGSFDCVAARFAVGNFAQDDRSKVL